MFFLNENDTELNDDVISNPGNEEETNLIEEDPENDAMIVESMLLEFYSKEEVKKLIQEMKLDDAIYNEKILTESTSVRMDKSVKTSGYQKQAVLATAREKNDSLFKKLVTVCRMKRCLENALLAKYEPDATRRVNNLIKKARSSKSEALRKAAASLMK